ncbi:uncharacterized protein VTP21DRAFT_3224 [Calcarisporiella thermophila]|uniref:uncharacterized protein n=1 Tax=Calcarisporiella thermophila TaxID=911321 RepID=UPI003741EB3C
MSYIGSRIRGLRTHSSPGCRAVTGGRQEWLISQRDHYIYIELANGKRGPHFLGILSANAGLCDLEDGFDLMRY